MNKSQELYNLIKCIRPLRRTLIKALEVELRDKDISVNQRVVLELLLNLGDQTVPQLAAEMSFQRQYIQKIANDLIEKNLVEVVKNPAHKKSNNLQISKKGKGLINSILTIEDQNLKKVAKNLSLNEIRLSTSVLEKINQSFSEQNKWRANE